MDTPTEALTGATQAPDTPDFRLRWRRLETDFVALTFLSLEDKWRIVESLGIARTESGTPLTAWRDAMLVENGLAPGVPFTHYGIDLSIDFAAERSLHIFVWTLA